MLWLYQIPTFWLGLLVVGAFVLFALAGLWLSRPWVRKHCNDYNELANAYIASISLFYAVLAGLIAIAVWENYSDVEEHVSREAAAVADLYHDAEGYPDPLRAELRRMLRGYVREVIEQEWPRQRRGIEPEVHGGMASQLTRRMASFEPATPGQQAIHAESLRQLDELLTYRRLRLQAVDGSLPGLMWLVLLVGAVVTLGMTFFFGVEDLRIHFFFTAMFGVMIALVIFLILSLDRPLTGNVSVDPDSFEDVLSTVMGEPAR